MKKIIIFSPDDHEAMVALVKNLLYIVNELEESYLKRLIYNKLVEVLKILTKENE